MVWFFAFLSLLLFVCLLTTLYFLAKTGKIVLDMIDAIQEQLDVFDDSYFRIGEILKTPVGSDDPFVRSVIEEIKNVQRSILILANKLSIDWNLVREKEEEEEEEDENDE